MDSINTAADQVLSGKNVRSATYRAAAEMAKQFGADDDTAWKVGLTVDVAVPIAFSLGLGAARVASIRVGRIKLIQHESVTGLKPGGHAILKHVGKTQEELAARLKTIENMVRKPNAVSSFSNIDLAEASVSKALSVNKEWIKVWAASHGITLPLHIIREE